MEKKHQDAYAIVRIDEWVKSPEIGCSEDSKFGNLWNTKVQVKKIVLDNNFAESEVERLNKLNQDKKCVYFYQYTRLE